MSRPKVLIIEDDLATCKQLTWALKDEFDVLTASDSPAALSLATQEHPSVILLDLGLPPRPADPEGGFRVLKEIRQGGGTGKVIVLTGHGERSHGVRAISEGAYDFFMKPVDVDLLKLVMQRAAWVWQLEQDMQRLPPDSEDNNEEMIGTSDSIRRIFVAIRKVATTDVPILIMGETGTGKELAAKAIHERSARRRGSFVPINCGAIPETLLESELFGYERGAFTGALQQKKGKVEYAQGGTLFLDEVGELPLSLQVKLLRFLQDQTIERVGGRQKIEVDARIIAATNLDLKKTIEEGTFREDLYYRLGVVTIEMPPLRERGEDVLLMAHVFLKRVSEQMRKRTHGFTKEAMEAIQTYLWPGNVRELSNKIRRAVVMGGGPYITPEDLDVPSPTGNHQVPPTSLRDARQRLEREIIAKALALNDSNLTRVAQELRISRPTLYALLRKYAIRTKNHSEKPASRNRTKCPEARSNGES